MRNFHNNRTHVTYGVFYSLLTPDFSYNFQTNWHNSVKFDLDIPWCIRTKDTELHKWQCYSSPCIIPARNEGGADCCSVSLAVGVTHLTAIFTESSTAIMLVRYEKYSTYRTVRTGTQWNSAFIVRTYWKTGSIHTCQRQVIA